MLGWLRKLFGPPQPEKVQKAPPYPEGFLKDYTGECPESIDSSAMRIIDEWTLEPFSDFQPPKVRFGYLNGTIILTVPSRIDENHWYGTFLVEEANLQEFITILEAAASGDWNHYQCSSILYAEPDSILMVLGSQKTGTLMSLESMRDVNLDGRRTSRPRGFHILDFCGAYLPEFISRLKHVQKSLHEA